MKTKLKLAMFVAVTAALSVTNAGCGAADPQGDDAESLSIPSAPLDQELAEAPRGCSWIRVATGYSHNRDPGDVTHWVDAAGVYDDGCGTAFVRACVFLQNANSCFGVIWNAEAYLDGNYLSSNSAQRNVCANAGQWYCVNGSPYHVGSGHTATAITEGHAYGARTIGRAVASYTF